MTTNANLSRTDAFYHHLIDVTTYLRGASFRDELKLDQAGLLSFHWADCQSTCLLEKSEVMYSPRGQARLGWLMHGLEKLKQIPTWLRGPQNTMQSNLYDTYDNFLEMPFRNILDAGKDLLISTTGQAGPYLPLMSHRWQDREIFRDFVIKKILTKKMPLRHFRIRSKLEGMVYFQGEDMDAFPVKLVQIMPSGLLFQWSSPILYTKLSEEKRAFFQIDLSKFSDVYDLSGRNSKSLNFRVDTYNFFKPGLPGPQSGAGNEVFLFVKFQDMRLESASEIFRPLVEAHYCEIRKACSKLMAGPVQIIEVAAA